MTIKIVIKRNKNDKKSGENMHSTNEGISANKEVFGYLMQQPDRMVNAIEQLLRSDILQTETKVCYLRLKETWN